MGLACDTCVHFDTCDRSLCLLFFESGLTRADLARRLIEWLEKRECKTLTPQSLEEFQTENPDLFRTTIHYSMIKNILAASIAESLGVV